MIGLDLQPYLLMNHLFSFKLILFVSGQNAGNQSTNAKKSQNTKQRKKIMFWGAFNSILKLPLYFVEGRMNSKKYCEILNTNLLPHVNNAFNLIILEVFKTTITIQSITVNIQWNGWKKKVYQYYQFQNILLT